jgi:hypothetical protein
VLEEEPAALGTGGNPGEVGKCWITWNQESAMERVAHKSKSYEEATRWDIEQQVRMTPEERLRAARILKDRAFPRDSKDVREWHRSA